jgi:hypothetical protein
MAERRKFRRRKTGVFFGIFERNTDKYFGRLVDITIQGVLLISERPIETDVVYQFRMDLPEEVCGVTSIIFDAESRWTQKSKEDGLYDTGFQFIRITPEDIEVIEYILDNFTEKVADAFTTVTPLDQEV